MPTKAKIALIEPCLEDSGRYFSLKLKQGLFIEPCEYQTPHKVLIISNIQGNFQALRNLLLQTGVINNGYQWTFEDGHLVIAGNCFGENEIGLECLWLIYALEGKARNKGGYVHFVLGKNELKNLNGNWRYLHPRYATNEKTLKPPYAILYDGNNELRRWLQTKNVIEKIGDVLISHTDVSTELLELGLSFTQLNNIARQYYSRRNIPDTEPLISKIFEESTKDPMDNINHKLNIKKITLPNCISGRTYIVTSSNNENNPTVIDPSNRIDMLLFRSNKFYRIKNRKREHVHFPGIDKAV